MAVRLEERVEVTEERIDRLEVLFGQFMSQTGMALLRMDRSIERMEQTVARLEKAAERDRQVWDERFDQDRQAWNKRWGELANKLGTIAEDIVAPNIPRIARELLGCDELDDFMLRRQVRSRDRSRRREFDVIAVCRERVVLVEVKATVRTEYVDEFIQVLKDVGDFFPQYADKPIIPVFASLYLGEDVVSYLTRYGIYALAMGEETMELVNFERVGPPPTELV